MSDIFREVDEDLRRDRLDKLWRRFSPALIGGAALVIAATAGYVTWDRWQTSRLQERTAVLAQALEKVLPQAGADGQPRVPDKAAGLEALTAVAGQLEGTQATLARLYEAGLRADLGERDAAVALYDQIAGSGSVEPIFRGLAALQAVMLQIDSGDPAQLQGRLTPLMQPDNPWRWSARELSALLAARAGNTAQAHELARQLAEDIEAPAGVRSRATELAALYATTK